jgi:hypothetical protein
MDRVYDSNNNTNNNIDYTNHEHLIVHGSQWLFGYDALNKEEMAIWLEKGNNVLDTSTTGYDVDSIDHNIDNNAKTTGSSVVGDPHKPVPSINQRVVLSPKHFKLQDLPWLYDTIYNTLYKKSQVCSLF